MRHFKHYCKIIFSTMAVVLVFACHSLVAHADPLTAAMLAAGAADAFSFSGMSGIAAGALSSLTDISYSDLLPWDDIVLAGKAYLTIHRLVGTNNVQVELSPEISSSGYDRITQFNNYYNLAPGSFHSYGTSYALYDYAFTAKGSSYYGPSLKTLTFPASDFTVSIGPSVFLSYGPRDGSVYYNDFSGSIGSYSNSGSATTYAPSGSHTYRVFLRYFNSTNTVQFVVVYDNNFSSPSTVLLGAPSSTSQVSPTAFNPSVSRANDSVITDPDGKSNAIVIPESSLSGISFVDGQTISSEADVTAILDKVSEAIANNLHVSSSYVEPIDPPSSETISDTPYITLDDTFTEFKEFFGDIYDGITSFHESFGDWVDNIASGWTEVFGDIFSDLHDFKEAFGDWVNDIASGWTEVFGDIYSTVSSIYSSISGTITNTLSAIATAVSTLVESIENADFQFIEGFWKNFITPFNNLFNTIKSHLSIWHYVVEWLSSISGVFTFYLGVMSGAGSGFLLPIYACFAGTVVLAVYKRFGK